MMDDNAPTHKRRMLVKTYKNVLPLKQIVVAEVSRETYSKNDGIENGYNGKIYPPKLKGEH